MNKKGFTLVELLAVIVIIAVIMLIGTVSINTVREKINENMFKTRVELVLETAKTYGQDNRNTAFSEGKTTISAQTLYDAGYLDEDDIEGIKYLKISLSIPNNRVNACIIKCSHNSTYLNDVSGDKFAKYYCNDIDEC